MPSLSQVTIAGHLGRDAKIKTVGDYKVTEFSVAVSPPKTDSPMWFDCSMWGKQGEAVAEYLTKGKAVLVMGRLATRDYIKKDETAGYSLEINVDQLQLLGDPGKAQEPAPAAKPPTPEDDIPF